MTQLTASFVEALIPRPARVSAPGGATVEPRPVTPARRRSPGWGRCVLDALLAGLLAAGAVAVSDLHVLAAATVALGWTVLLWAGGHYRQHPLGETSSTRARRVVVTGLRACVCALACIPIVVGESDPLVLAGLAAALTMTSLAAGLWNTAGSCPRVVLAGRPRDVREALVHLQTSGACEVVAVCLTRPTKVPIVEAATYLGLDQATPAAQQHGADALVVLPTSHFTPVALRRLQWAAASLDLHVYLGTGLLDVEPTRTRVLTHAGLDVLHIRAPTLSGPRRVLKDVLERATACFGLLMALPLLLVIATLIRIETPGPAIFRQRRIGRDGIPFTMLKFRSMSSTAEAERTGLIVCNESDGVLFKIRQDPRVTPVGRWLRRYSLDELPQLWNVVRGDMSLIGPRPALPDEVAGYDFDPRRRLVVKPGVTGLWQVSGRSDLTWSESVRLDLRYVDNWCLRLDLQILARTLAAVVGHRGAY